jgi:lipopolysaccharide transport system ATP-binding protein
VSKGYHLWKRPQDRLRHALFGRFGKSYGRFFWALRDVSFDVRPGEAVGIVGRNGSGKSTLLEIVAGTVAPTEGEVRLGGRVAALLELGSGFNPEFTGRENVFLTGSLLGVDRVEMVERFAEIAAFADIGEFMEQPLRTYSSGMIVRLAFAVQAMLRKDLLLIDEALVVGDEAFQQKCMALLKRFRDAGGTLLLVSHDTQAIVRHCERCLLLHGGELLADGASKPVTDAYQKLLYAAPEKVAHLAAELRRLGPEALSSAREGATPASALAPGEASPLADPADGWDPEMPATDEVRYGNGDAEICEFGLFGEDGRRVNVVVAGQRYRWTYTVRFLRDAWNVNFGMMLKTVDGVDVAGLSSDREMVGFDRIEAGATVVVEFSFRMSVVPGTYLLNSGVGGLVDGRQTYLSRRVDIAMLRVLPADQRPRYGIAELEHRFAWRRT